MNTDLLIVLSIVSFVSLCNVFVFWLAKKQGLFAFAASGSEQQ